MYRSAFLSMMSWDFGGGAGAPGIRSLDGDDGVDEEDAIVFSSRTCTCNVMGDTRGVVVKYNVESKTWGASCM